MITESVVQGLIKQVLNQICIDPEYDLIDVLPVVDCDGSSFKFWVKRRDHTIAEGQCYVLYEGEDSDPVILVYNITCPRFEPVADQYEAWFDGTRLTRKFHGNQVVPLR